MMHVHRIFHQHDGPMMGLRKLEDLGVRPGVAYLNTAFLRCMYAGKIWSAHAALVCRGFLNLIHRLTEDEAGCSALKRSRQRSMP